MANEQTAIVRDVVQRLNHLPTRSIARYLLSMYGGMFENNLERARSAVRYVRGESGVENREKNNNILPAEKQEMPDTWRRVTTPYELPSGKYLFIMDAHVPFHEKVPLEAALKYGLKRKVDGIVMNGDMQDCSALSFWKSVIRKDFMKEVLVFLEFLDYLRQMFPKEVIVYKPGNHEYRLPRYFAERCPELVETPLVAMETLLDFEGRGIEFLDYHQLIMAGELPVVHGHEFRTITSSVNPARGLFLRANSWALCGHLHRTSEHTDTNIKDTYLTAWSVGCLCDLHPDYSPFGSKWNWGCAIVTIDDKGNFEVENKRILHGGKVV
jgi:predicted phosphodiesterase